MIDVRLVAGRAFYRVANALPDAVVARVQDLVARNRRARRVVSRLTGPARAGAHPIANGPAKGLLIDVAGSRPSYVLGIAEPELLAVMQHHVRPGDTVLDLGANVGYFTLVCAALVGPAGRVAAYEPMPETARALRRNVTLNGLRHVDVVEAAVSDRRGTAHISVNRTNQDASLVHRSGEATIAVSTVCVDDEVARLGIRPTFVKIDVEGAEEDVLAGMRRTLSEHRPVVVCEIHTLDHDVDGPVPRTLRSAGYTATWLEEGVAESELYWAPHLVAIPPSRP